MTSHVQMCHGPITVGFSVRAGRRKSNSSLLDALSPWDISVRSAVSCRDGTGTVSLMDCTEGCSVSSPAAAPSRRTERSAAQCVVWTYNGYCYVPAVMYSLNKNAFCTRFSMCEVKKKKIKTRGMSHFPVNCTFIYLPYLVCYILYVHTA